MTLARYSPPGLGLNIRSNTWKPRKCVICKRVISKPGAKNQKTHDGTCRQKLAIQRAEKYERKQKAAQGFKKERKRIGVIKGNKPERDTPHKRWIRTLPCLICFLSFWKHFFNGHCSFDEMIVLITLSGKRQRDLTESAHVGERGMRQTASDKTTLPLCGGKHHREGKESAHKLQKAFWAHHGLDRDEVLAKLNALRAVGRKAA